MNRLIHLVALCSALSLPAFGQAKPRPPRGPDGGFEDRNEEGDQEDGDEAPPHNLGEHLREQMRRDRMRRGGGGPRTATLAVKGPVLFRVHSQAGDVEVQVTDKLQVTATLEGGPDQGIVLKPDGDRVEAAFGGGRQLRHGHLRLELPKGSSLDFESMSGDLTVQKIGGDVRARTMSGDVKVSGVASADVQTISGDAAVEAAGGAVRVHTVSGNGTINTVVPAPDVEFQSASGGLSWSGTCAKGCRLTSETVSGDVRLLADPKSSFLLSFASHSGDLQDEMSLTVKHAPTKKHGGGGGWLEAAYGSGDGRVECNSFSGSVQVKKR
jgi:Putative adhesin